MTTRGHRTPTGVAETPAPDTSANKHVEKWSPVHTGGRCNGAAAVGDSVEGPQIIKHRTTAIPGGDPASPLLGLRPKEPKRGLQDTCTPRPQQRRAQAPGGRVSVWEDGKVKTDGFTTRICLTPLNWTLKMVQMAHFTLCVFDQSKENEDLKGGCGGGGLGEGEPTSVSRAS